MSASPPRCAAISVLGRRLPAQPSQAQPSPAHRGETGGRQEASQRGSPTLCCDFSAIFGIRKNRSGGSPGGMPEPPQKNNEYAETNSNCF